ncbi:MAG: hypothetical protein GY869_27295 [Planctomycetes bacterium]|nr:hypothetical protein [Planctomycetota bacterium]
MQVGAGDEAEIRVGRDPQLVLRRDVANDKFKIQVTGSGYNGKVLQIGRDDENHDILLTGDVGVGTSNPQARLHVANGETILEQEPWQATVFLNGWIDYGGGYNAAGYFKDSVGVVHLRGLVKSGSVGQVIFTLPVGYRPAGRAIHPVMTYLNVMGRVDITASGEVILIYGSNAWVSLENITFRADQ